MSSKRYDNSRREKAAEERLQRKIEECHLRILSFFEKPQPMSEFCRIEIARNSLLNPRVLKGLVFFFEELKLLRRLKTGAYKRTPRKYSLKKARKLSEQWCSDPGRFDRHVERCRNIDDARDDAKKKWKRCWNRTNMERLRTYSHKRRAALKGIDSPGVPASVFRKQCQEREYRCSYCFVQTSRLQREHVVPLARGGRDAPDNVIPACKTCNSSKGAKLLHDWLDLPILTRTSL